MSNKPRARQRSKTPPPKAVQRTRTALSRAPQRPKRSTFIIVCAIAVVVAGGLIAAVVAGSSSSSGSTAPVLTVPTGDAAAAVATAVTSVPSAVTDQVAVGAVTGFPTALKGDALTDGGKPALLYIGAEYCPYCAGERWAMVNALARFGTFTGLALTHSSSSDVFPSTQTFTFRNAKYSSRYISFSSLELSTNESDGNGGYKALQTPTAQQLQIWSTADPGRTYPFLDIGGRYLVSGASYNVSVLQGKDATMIAGLLSDPTTPVAKGVLGTANVLTAAICAQTGNQPAAVCNAAGVAAARGHLPATSS